jgi:RNA polymerase sigma factor for flagellar operon FliA
MVALEAEIRVDELWREYVATRDHEVRNQLLVYYSHLVKYVASRLASSLPQNIEHGDLVSNGFFGLIDAVDRFDPDRGNKFETYAMQRIRGAILDELRSNDWVPRSVRQKHRAIEKAMAKLEGRLGRTPTERELAPEAGMTIIQLQHALTQISNAGLVALDEVVTSASGHSESLALIDTLPDRSDGPAGHYERREMKEILAAAIDSMGDREKWVLLLYYFERFTLADIGKVLNVTESRVCQIHTKAVMQLRLHLQLRMNN